MQFPTLCRHLVIGCCFGAVAALGFFPEHAEAANRYWVGSAGGNFNDSANWASADPASCTGGGASAPGTSDIAIFDADCDNNATMNATVNVAGINIASGYSGTISPSGTISIYVGTSSFIQAGGTFTATSSGMVLNAGSFTRTGGIFTHNSGTVVMKAPPDESTTTLTPGSSLTFYNLTFDQFHQGSGDFNFISLAGSFTVANDFTMRNDAMLDDYDVIATGTPTVTVEGTLNFPSTSSTYPITFGSSTLSENFTVNLTGNFAMEDSGIDFRANVRLSGSGNQNISHTAGSFATPSTFLVMKSGTGTITSTSFSPFNLRVSSGGLAGSTVTSMIPTGAVTVNGGHFVAPNLATLRATGAFTYGTGTFLAPSSHFKVAAYTQTSSKTVAAPNVTSVQSFALSNGTFTAGTNMTSSGTMTLTSGTFNAPSGTLTIIDGNFTRTSAAFNHSSGTVVMKAPPGEETSTLTPGSSLSFYNLTFDQHGVGSYDANIISLGGSFTVVNDLTVQNTAASPQDDFGVIAGSSTYVVTVGGDFLAPSTAAASLVNSFGSSTAGENFTVNLAGDFTMSDSNVTLRANFTFNGTTNQTITHSAGSISGGTWTVSRSSETRGTAVKLGTNFSSRPFTVSAGTFSLEGFNLTSAASTVASGGRFRLQGGETVTNAPTLNAGSEVIYHGTSIYTVKDWTYQGLSFSGSGIFNLGAAESIGQALTLSGATFDISGQNLTVTGNLYNNGKLRLQGGETTVSLAAMDTDSGIVEYDGSSSYTGLKAGNSYYTLSFSGAGTWTLNASLDTNSGFTIPVSTATVDANSRAITVGGNWLKRGVFTAGTSTVTLDGANQTVSGSTTFSTLVKTVSVARTLTFAQGQSFIASTALTLRGAASNLLSLRSSLQGTAYTLRLTSGGTQTIDYLSVRDSNASGGEELQCVTSTEECVNVANNTNWFFAASESSGASDDGGESVDTGDSGGGTRGAQGNERIRESLEERGREEDPEDTKPAAPPSLTIEVDSQWLTLVDVPSGEWFAEFVQDVIGVELMSGYRDIEGNLTGEFGPDDPVTLEQVAKVAVLLSKMKLSGCPEPRNTTGDEWSKAYVGCAEAKEWKVYVDPATDLHRPATRAEVVQTILEAFKKIPDERPMGHRFSDVSLEHPFILAISQAASDGIIAGYTDRDGELTGMFGPENKVNRAEFAKIVAMAQRIYAK